MEKKYELTDETIEVGSHILHRIKALRSFGGVNKGNLGGFIEKEENLSHEGDCWVYGNAVVADKAYVYDNAQIFCNAYVCGNAEVYDNAKVFGYAVVSNHAKVYSNTKVYGNAEVYDNAEISGNAEVCGDAVVDGMAEISGDAVVKEMGDYMVFHNTWSSGRYFTWTRSNNMWSVGCFYGTGKELIEKAYRNNKKSGKGYERVVKYVESILADGSD